MIARAIRPIVCGFCGHEEHGITSACRICKTPMHPRLTHAQIELVKLMRASHAFSPALSLPANADQALRDTVESLRAAGVLLAAWQDTFKLHPDWKDQSL